MRLPIGPGRGVLARCLSAVALLALLGCGPSSDEPANPAPDFDLERVRGGRVALKDLRGKTVILDFWATWCTPCLESIPELNAIHAEYEKKGIQVVGVSVDTLETPELLRWVDDTSGHEPMWYEILKGDIALAESYGAFAFPHTVIVSPEGNILESLPSLQTKADLEAALRKHGRL
jgi:thiol-disulfide isomerase/thioredoxin